MMLIPNSLVDAVHIQSSCCILGPEISLGRYVPRVFWGCPVRARRSPRGIVDQGVERLLVGLGAKRGMERRIGC